MTTILEEQELVANDRVHNGAPSAGPTVDVVIPCYNYARYLRACVESVVSQKDVGVRVLIIDDSSSDHTPQIGRELQSRYEHVEFRRHEQNCGHIATYNEGLIGWSTSKYCMLLSADDLLTPGALSRAVQIMEADATIGMVYGSTIHFFDEAELPAKHPTRYRHITYTGAKWIAGRCRSAQNVITSPEAVLRGSIQRAIGGYRSDLPHTGDLEMWLRVAAVSNVAYVAGPPQAFYRVHKDSMMRSRYSSKVFDFFQRKAAFDTFFVDHTSMETSAWRDSVYRILAKEALWDVCRAFDHDEVDPQRERDLVDFAMETYPQATSLPEYSALQRRRFLGANLCHRTQAFFLPAAFRWAVRSLRKARWRRVGI